MGLLAEVKAWFVNSRDNQLLRVLTSEDINEKFFVNDLDEVTKTLFYVGEANRVGDYIIKQITGDKDITTRYATIENNPLVLTYQDAWDNRLTLIYDQIENL